MFYRKHPRVLQPVGSVSMTKQSHKDECDINNILKQYQRTGIINHINNHKGEYMDLPSDVDYQLSLNTVIQADYAFSTLPSKVRDYFGNDPERFLAAFSDPAQAEKLLELGLVEATKGAVRPKDNNALSSSSSLPEQTSLMDTIAKGDPSPPAKG